jgi:AcrR family transcriptional regulator
MARSDPPKLGRKEKARATRTRMVQAAYKLFCDKGYVATTMEAIAREAGIAVQTLYFTFHNKTALLQEVFDASVLGHEKPVPPEAAPWFAAFHREPNGARALRILVDNASEILRRVAPLAATMTAAAGDPVAAEVYQRGEALRRKGFHGIVRHLAEKHGLRAGLTVERAVDVLFALLSPEMFHAMSRSGWSFDEWTAWVSDLLVQQLLARAGRRG